MLYVNIHSQYVCLRRWDPSGLSVYRLSCGLRSAVRLSNSGSSSITCATGSWCGASPTRGTGRWPTSMLTFSAGKTLGPRWKWLILCCLVRQKIWSAACKTKMKSKSLQLCWLSKLHAAVVFFFFPHRFKNERWDCSSNHNFPFLRLPMHIWKPPISACLVQMIA